jgi:hypothetical protein
MGLHAQIVLILLSGVAILYVVFGTNWLFDTSVFQTLPPEEFVKAVPFWLGPIAGIGLACVVFGLQFLIAGDKTVPLRILWPMLGLAMVGSAVMRRRAKAR